MTAMTSNPSILEEVRSFLLAEPTPEQILAFKEPEEVLKRLCELLTSRRERELLENEQAELDLLIETEHLLRRLKSEALMQVECA